MFKNWGAWLGIENENGRVKQEGESVVVDVNGDKTQDINRPTAAESEQTRAAEEDASPPHLLQKAKGFSGKFD